MKEDLKKIRVSFEALLLFAESEQCMHESTHRGGAIWTICDECGKKWADDEGGFKPYVAPKALQDAEKALVLLKRLEQEQKKSPGPPEHPNQIEVLGSSVLGSSIEPKEAWQIYIDQQIAERMRPMYEAYGVPMKVHKN